MVWLIGAYSVLGGILLLIFGIKLGGPGLFSASKGAERRVIKSEIEGHLLRLPEVSPW